MKSKLAKYSVMAAATFLFSGCAGNGLRTADLVYTGRGHVARISAYSFVVHNAGHDTRFVRANVTVRWLPGDTNTARLSCGFNGELEDTQIVRFPESHQDVTVPVFVLGPLGGDDVVASTLGRSHELRCSVEVL